MTTRIKLRRDTSANWEIANPVLALGEPGYDTTENKIKVGNGVTAWMDLDFLTDANFTLTPATNNALGGIKVGNNLTITEDGTLNAEDGNYTLPAAATNTLGGVKLGEGFVLNGSNQVTTSKLYSTNQSQPNQHYRLELTTGGTIKLPDQSEIIGSTLKGIYGTGDMNYTGITAGPSAQNSENTWMYVDAYNAYIATDYADNAYTWKFDNNGILNFPKNNGQIGQLESPYTGLEFRTGSGADWIGISYGEIEDNNTSYFYFDKDGSDYLTANHRAHLQIKNPAHDGHVEWLFDSEGILHLPVDGDIVNSNGDTVLGAANLGNFTFDGDTLNMPLESRLNSGGDGIPNSAEIGTTVAFDGPDIVNSEVFMGSGYGEFRSIYNKTSPLESGLVYAGVEGFNYTQQGDVNFAGMVSQTPNIDSMYALSLNEQGQIVIGFTQRDQTQVSTDWSVVVGTLTTDYTVNGLFANTTTTVIGSGLSSWTFDNNGTLIVPANGIEFPNGSYIKQQEEEGLILWQTDENAIDNDNDSEYIGLWYGGDPADDAPNVSITAGSYNWSTDDDNLQYINYPDQGADQGLRQINLDIRLDNDNILNWHFDTSGNFYLPADPSVVGIAGIVFPDGTVQTTASSNTGTSFEAPLPSWIDVISGTQHLPTVNTDYGFDSLGVWTVNATILDTGPEGTSYPFRTSFTIANNLKTVVTVDFDHQASIGGEGDTDFGIGVFAAGTDPVWAWDGTTGNLGANRIGAQYNGPEPELHGISDGVDTNEEYGLPEYGTYRARLTIEPVDPGVAQITLETLTTTGTLLNTITYLEESFFDTDYQIGFASDADGGNPRVYFKNLTINVDNGADLYVDALTDYSSVLVATNSQLTNNGFTVTLKTDGKLELPQLSTIADVEAGVELTINRESPQWYSIYGDLSTLTSDNHTASGSVVHDNDGNIYVLGSIVTQTGGNFPSNNLFLKYNDQGVLQWSRTWTDDANIDCGSYNASMRFVPADLGIQGREKDVIFWASYAPYQYYAYVGTMDTDGDLVAGADSSRAPVQLMNTRLADIEVSIDNKVYVVGARLDGYPTSEPFIATIDLDNYTATSAITIAPPYIDINYNQPWTTNFFKSATHDGTALYAIGTYFNDDYGYHWPILTKHIDGSYTRTYHLTHSNQYQSYYGEEVAYSTVNDAVYVLMQFTDISGDFSTIGKLASDLSEYTWMRRFGDGVNVRLLSMEFDADGFIYIVGDLADVDNGDFILIKMADNGDCIWQRKIGTNAGYEGSGEGEFGAPGWGSSSSIIIDGTDVVFTGIIATSQIGALTIKYPTNGELTGDFGNFHAVEYDVGFVDDWIDSIADLTISTVVTDIAQNNGFTSDIGPAGLIATTKTLDEDFETYHWDMTNNHRYIPERKWTFGVDGSITLPSGAYLEEDEPGTLNIHSTGGTAINYSKHAQVADYLEGETTFAGVTTASSGVTVTVDKKISSSNVERNEWIFRNNSGLQFPDGSIQYGAFIDEEIALDGGSAVSVFPTITTPRAADGGGSSSRFGIYDPTYDGSSNGAYTNPDDFTLLLNGGGA